MRGATVCILVRGDPPDQVLLGFKKAGFAAGKYNGIGGKVEPGETVIGAAVREMEEEIGVKVAEENLSHMGHFTFLFPAKPAWNQVVHAFLVRNWQGEPRESAEMAPAWFAVNEIPYERMWQDNAHWLPRVLAGEQVRARYIYGEDNETIVHLETEPWNGSEQLDPKQIVARGYDRIVEEHARWARDVRADERARYGSLLLERLHRGAEVLELGCGVGLPTTRLLAGRFAVTGVDISEAQIARARQNVPSATFIQADMAALDFPPASFDAVAAFYSLIHVPRQEQAGLLKRIASWLRPDGLLVATMGTQATEAGYEQDWLGAPMYWSSFDSQTNQRLVAEAGLRIVSAREETADEFGQPVTFLWIVGQKPARLRDGQVTERGKP